MAKSAAKAVPVSVSYRAERTSTYGWQAYKITVYSDNTIQVEPCFKEDVLDIVLRRIGAAVKQEGQTEFLQRKALADA